MWRAFLLLMLLSLSGLTLSAQTLSNQAEISLLTASPGRDLYAAFGHSAVWVSDPMLGIDKVYNYGTFDFNPPGFYFEFAQGKLNYYVGTESFRRFDYIYEYLQRAYTAQTYDLSQPQKQAIYEFLETNALPENKYYLYDFFFDNCSSRIRDMFEEVLGDSLILAEPDRSTDSTFRDMTDLYLRTRPWEDFWIDLGLGSVVDVPTTPRDQMFLPDYLESELGKASIIRNGEKVPFVKDHRVIRDLPSVVGSTPWYISPQFIFWLLFAAVLGMSIRNFSKQRTRHIGDGILFLLMGLGGIVVFLLWFATDHTATAWNWNLLWLTPTHLVASFYLFRKRQPVWLKYYFLAIVVLGLILVLFGHLFPIMQALSPYALPLLLILIMRSGILYQKMAPSTSD